MYPVAVSGIIDGLCHSSDLRVGQDYVVYVRARDNGDLVIAETQLDATTDNLAEVAKVCGLTPRAVAGLYILSQVHKHSRVTMQGRSS